MADQLLASLEGMGQLLLAMDTGAGLLIGVGLSMSASHLFAELLLKDHLNNLFFQVAFALPRGTADPGSPSHKQLNDKQF